jgi:hypothetical protein
MTTTNILILNFSSSRADDEKNAGLAEAAAAQMEAGYKAAVELQTTENLFLLGYWVCNNKHAFARSQIESPRQCPVCESRLFRWIPGPGLSEAEN